MVLASVEVLPHHPFNLHPQIGVFHIIFPLFMSHPELQISQWLSVSRKNEVAPLFVHHHAAHMSVGTRQQCAHTTDSGHCRFTAVHRLGQDSDASVHHLLETVDKAIQCMHAAPYLMFVCVRTVLQIVPLHHKLLVQPHLLYAVTFVCIPCLCIEPLYISDGQSC